MKILFNDFKRHYKAEKKKIDSAVQRVLGSGYFILGKEVLHFEKKFASYLGTTHAIGVANGLEALQISLMALAIGEGDEVITTADSAVATALAIRLVGATPVFVDIDDFYHIDARKIEEKITKKTKAIIPVHLYGQSADMDTIGALANKYHLHIVEDCAQAHGARYKEKHVGTFGIAGCFSFYPTKNLGAYGDAGAIVTGDTEFAEKCRIIRNYGQKNRYEHPVIGINSRLDELQAGIVSAGLFVLKKNNARRNSIAQLYREALSSIKKIKLPLLRDTAYHVYHLFVIETETRDGLMEFLRKKNIATLIHYPIPIHKQACFPEHNSLSLPILEEKVKKILSLPIHPYLFDSEVKYITDSIKEYYEI